MALISSTYNPEGKDLRNSTFKKIKKIKRRSKPLPNKGYQQLIEILDQGGIAEIVKREFGEAGVERVTVEITFIHPDNQVDSLFPNKHKQK